MTSVFRTIDPQQQSPKNRSTLAHGSDPLQNEVGFPQIPEFPANYSWECAAKLHTSGLDPSEGILKIGLYNPIFLQMGKSVVTDTHTQTDNADTDNLSYIGPPLRS